LQLQLLLLLLLLLLLPLLHSSTVSTPSPFLSMVDIIIVPVFGWLLLAGVCSHFQYRFVFEAIRLGASAVGRSGST
jgi:hypothetical protein